MIETMCSLVLLLAGTFEHEPMYIVASGLFAIAVNVGNLRRPEYHETNQH